MDEPKVGDLVSAKGEISRITRIHRSPFEYAEVVPVKTGVKTQCPLSKIRKLTDFEVVISGLL